MPRRPAAPPRLAAVTLTGLALALTATGCWLKRPGTAASTPTTAPTPPGTPTARADRNDGTTYPGWGTLHDPLNDTRVEFAAGKLTMTVPPGLHDINPTLGGMKAPRILQEVSGDFTLEVTVTGDFAPGPVAAAEGLPSFHGAGLSLWVDDKTYLRLERNAWWNPAKGAYVCYTPLYEIFNRGRPEPTNPGVGTPAFFGGDTTRFRLERSGLSLTTSHSADRGATWQTVPRVASTLPRSLFVGVGAVSTSAAPLTVVFEDFKLTRK